MVAQQYVIKIHDNDCVSMLNPSRAGIIYIIPFNLICRKISEYNFYRDSVFFSLFLLLLQLSKKERKKKTKNNKDGMCYTD